ncbi:MAG TPA: hypothetical protein VG297_19850 [Bryobacteraceae bacterium]|nr:hypothetical protein [Bryobacteraceae bacterium]
MLKQNLAAIAVVLGLLPAATGTAAIAAPVFIQLDGGSFKVTGWDPPRAAPAKGWASIFAVYAGVSDLPPVAGTYSAESNALIFRPSFPIAPGVHYRAIFRSQAGGAPIEKTFDGPARDLTPTTRVEHVYPSADVLPSNQLRIYIYFSQPMSRNEAGQRIHMLDEHGKALPGVFLPGEELWSPDFRRLTMTLDPGRIKRGLTSNEAMGPPITEGKRYILVIDRDWLDAHGVRMTEGFRKPFRGGPSQRNPPDPKQWKISAPKAGTVEALTVDFPAPMNYPLLQRMLQVDGVAGAAGIDKQETEWRFIPKDPWKPGDHRLTVDTGLEDLAGNHIGQAFDLDVFKRVTEHIAAKTMSIPFTVR